MQLSFTIHFTILNSSIAKDLFSHQVLQSKRQMMATERRKTRLVAASTPLVLTPTPTPPSPPSTGIQKNERIFKNARNLPIRAKHLYF
jgi:hypothetical protein